MPNYKKISAAKWTTLTEVIVSSRLGTPKRVRDCLKLLGKYGRGSIVPCSAVMDNFSTVEQVNTFLRKNFPHERLRVVQSGYKIEDISLHSHENIRYPNGYFVQLATMTN